MKKKTRGELLSHYSEKEPTEFIQFDVFYEDGGPWNDGLMVSDEEGFAVIGGKTTELMSGCSAIRVLIIPGTEKGIVTRGLKKVIRDIEKCPYLLKKEYYNTLFP